MRIFATSLLAFFASLFAGGMITQMLAVASNGSEEWIGVFMLTVLVAMAMTVVFFVAQFRADQSRAAGSVAKWSLIIFAVLLAILAAATIATDGIDQVAQATLPITAGLTLPGMAIIIVQWLIVRWRAPAACRKCRASDAEACRHEERRDEDHPLLWRFPDLGLQRRGPAPARLEDRWPSVLQAALGAAISVIAEGLNGRTTAFDDHTADADRNGARVLPTLLVQPLAARPGHHPARHQRHEAVHFGPRLRLEAGRGAAGRDRARRGLPARRRAAAGADRLAAAAQRDRR